MPASVEEAWAVMLDIERVAPCLPGASIEGSEGDEYSGTMKIKLGPVELQLRGHDQDRGGRRGRPPRRPDARRARDSRGAGTAAATITSTMAPADEGTRVKVETELQVTGPAATFGRGVCRT